MTQQALSERLGVSDKTVGNWENGRNLPDPSLYKPLCPAALFTDLFNRACFCRNVPLLFRHMHKGDSVSAEHRQKNKQHGNGLLQQSHPRVHYPEADRRKRSRTATQCHDNSLTFHCLRMYFVSSRLLSCVGLAVELAAVAVLVDNHNRDSGYFGLFLKVSCNSAERGIHG